MFWIVAEMLQFKKRHDIFELLKLSLISNVDVIILHCNVVHDITKRSGLQKLEKISIKSCKAEFDLNFLQAIVNPSMPSSRLISILCSIIHSTLYFVLQSNQAKRTPLDSINESII